MRTFNLCRKMDLSDKIALSRYAKRLEADEMTIHHDGSITLVCSDGIICEHYFPTRKELNAR